MAIYTTQCVEKPFSELTKEDFRSMRRVFPRVQLDDIYAYYNVGAMEFFDRMEEFGVRKTNEERKSYIKDRDIKQPKPKPITKRRLSRKELHAIRLFRGYTRHEFARKLCTTELSIRAYEKGKKPSEAMESRYIQIMKITETELKRIRMVLSGEVDSIEVERAIPDVVKDEVYKKYKGQCGKCGDKRKLHYHHIKHFADGGLHQVNNLVLLCVMCHAGEHKDELVFRMLMSIAEELEMEGEPA